MTNEETAVVVADLVNQEGREVHMYLDTAEPPRVTWGIGVMFPGAIAAVSGGIRWMNVTAGRPATVQEVVAEWGRVHAMPGGHSASFYRGRAPAIETSEADADAYCVAQLEAGIYPDLRAVFPGFDSLPLNARRALVDIRWNVGPGGYGDVSRGIKASGIRAFAHLREALTPPSPDYEAAALASSRIAKTPHAVARNAWTAGMFRSCKQA